MRALFNRSGHFNEPQIHVPLHEIRVDGRQLGLIILPVLTQCLSREDTIRDYEDIIKESTAVLKELLLCRNGHRT